ncbi:MAG: hypothetical protein NVSMB59_02830 [Vulcanimicrobiaceae bacterium]
MEPLDLSTAPPRAPRAELAGIVFLPRSIDKVRASLPGGHLGPYQIEGFTLTMLESLGISIQDFTESVCTATGDADVAAFVTARAKPGGVDVWHRYVNARRPKNGDLTEAIAAYPFLVGRTETGFSLDVLAEDDAYIFARKAERA